MVVSLSTLTPAELEEFAELKAECDKNHTDYALDNEYVLSVLEASQMCANSGRNLLKKIHLWRTSKDGILPGVTSIFDVTPGGTSTSKHEPSPHEIVTKSPVATFGGKSTSISIVRTCSSAEVGADSGGGPTAVSAAAPTSVHTSGQRCECVLCYSVQNEEEDPKHP